VKGLRAVEDFEVVWSGKTHLSKEVIHTCGRRQNDSPLLYKTGHLGCKLKKSILWYSRKNMLRLEIETRQEMCDHRKNHRNRITFKQ
jgi:hypothetical protein